MLERRIRIAKLVKLGNHSSCDSWARNSLCLDCIFIILGRIVSRRKLLLRHCIFLFHYTRLHCIFVIFSLRVHHGGLLLIFVRARWIELEV